MNDALHFRPRIRDTSNQIEMVFGEEKKTDTLSDVKDKK